MSDKSEFDTEKQVILAVQQGVGESFTKLVDLYDKRLLYFVRRLMGDEGHAQDVMQIVWLTVYRHIDSLRIPEAFRAWVYRIAHDQAVTELRRRGNRIEVSIESQPVAILAEDHQSDESVFEHYELVHRGLRELSFEHRRVLTLKFLEDMSIDQIAEVIQTQPGTVKSRLYYAKSELRHWIEAQLHE